MADATGTLFAGLEVLEVVPTGAAEPCRRATATAGRLACQMGATVWTDGAIGLGPDRGFMLGKRSANAAFVADPYEWAAASPGRVVMLADDGSGSSADEGHACNVVRVVAEPWHNEATLFAASGLADLLGEPEGPPLIPSGEWAACTVAYAVLGALASAQALSVRGEADVITVDCVDALRWINWKAAAMAWVGAPVSRQGASGEWPVLPCVDGYVAFVFTARDWKRVVEMVDDDRLRDERFKRYEDRKSRRAEYTPILAEWAATRSKAELDDLFHRHAIPGASVATPADLLVDPTIVHRGVFANEHVEGVDGEEVPVPVAPVRVRAVSADEPTSPRSVEKAADRVVLPLDGVRILDLGVLTAGAGTSSLLADLGAEVIKIESAERPDMFRFWAGSDDSPLFHFSNRSKLGVDLNLKDPAERAVFLELVAGADAVIENFRRGVLERLGLGFDELRAVNPRIVLGSVSGQGADGPRADHTTFGSTLEAASGFSALVAHGAAAHTGGPASPLVSGANLNFPDQTVCLFAGAALAAAITRSRAAGTAMHLDISQRDVAVYAAGPVVEQAARGAEPRIWATHAGPGGGWLASGSDGSIDIAVLDGDGVLAACTETGSSAIVRAPNGDLAKGFPVTFARRRSTISRPAPAIGEHNDLIVGDRVAQRNAQEDEE